MLNKKNLQISLIALSVLIFDTQICLGGPARCYYTTEWFDMKHGTFTCTCFVEQDIEEKGKKKTWKRNKFLYQILHLQDSCAGPCQAWKDTLHLPHSNVQPRECSGGWVAPQ